jgi:hypothetical protein
MLLSAYLGLVCPYVWLFSHLFSRFTLLGLSAPNSNCETQTLHLLVSVSQAGIVSLTSPLLPNLKTRAHFISHAAHRECHRLGPHSDGSGIFLARHCNQAWKKVAGEQRKTNKAQDK